MERKPCYIEPKLYDAICDFLNHIADHVGDKIIEYHWREACDILLSIDNPEQKERRSKLLHLKYENIKNDDINTVTEDDNEDVGASCGAFMFDNYVG